ncbi:MAG: galactokinase, partial [Chitinivibrionales bacterium]|nr:galactokinase [Chitinivibrionales bacterium]
MHAAPSRREGSFMSGALHSRGGHVPATETGAIYSGRFGAEPAAVTRAPGRVELLGNHTDYNNGFVLSAAIDRYVYAAAGPARTKNTFEFFSTRFSSVIALTEAIPQQGNAWVNYPLGVYGVMKDAGLPVGPFTLAISGTVPMGAGLSSSAALEVASGLALARTFGFDVDPVEMALLCRKAENAFCGAECGLLDQFSVLFGKKNHALFIDFRSLDHTAVPVDNPDMLLAITTSGVTHAVSDSAYNDRRTECAKAAEFFSKRNRLVSSLRDVSQDMLESARGEMDDILFRRAAHVVGENDRVLKGIALLQEGNLGLFGELLYESHESSRTDFENSCPELDALVDCARSISGVYGARLT